MSEILGAETPREWWGFPWPCLVGARFLALVNSKKILPLITVSNEVSLQNQL